MKLIIVDTGETSGIEAHLIALKEHYHVEPIEKGELQKITYIPGYTPSKRSTRRKNERKANKLKRKYI